MEEKDFNLRILDELKKVAREVFDETTVTICGKNEGFTLTAAELAKGKDSSGNKILLSRNEEKAYTIKVDSFSCTTTSETVFNHVWRFEQLANLKQSDKARFVKREKKETLCSFEMVITKGHTSLAKFVESGTPRPAMNNIYIDVPNKRLVASDGYILREMPIQIDAPCELPECTYFYIRPQDIKHLTGKCMVTKFKDYTEIINSKGDVFSCDCNINFLNYRSVYSNLSHEGYVKVSKKDIPALKAFAKGLTKEYDDSFTIELSKRSDKMTCTCKDKHISVNLENPALVDITARISAKNVYTITLSGWNGGIWALNQVGTGAVFDSADGGVMLSMYKDICRPIERVDYDVPTLSRLDLLNTGELQCAPTPEMSANSRKQPEKLLPAIYTAPESVQITAIFAIVSALKELFDTFIRIELDKAVERLRMLAGMCGVDAASLLQAAEVAAVQEPVFGNEPEPMPDNDAQLEIKNGAESTSIPHAELFLPFPVYQCGVSRAAGTSCVRNIAPPPAIYPSGLNSVVYRWFAHASSHRIRDGPQQTELPNTIYM